MNFRCRLRLPDAMKLMNWNCRDWGSPLAARALVDFDQNAWSQVLGLIETKIDSRRVEGRCRRMGFNCGLVFDRRGIGGVDAIAVHDEMLITGAPDEQKGANPGLDLYQPLRRPSIPVVSVPRDKLSFLDNWKSLPKDLEVLMVNKLPMVEVFRLSTVCRDFSCLWKDIRNLNFNKKLMIGIETRGLNFQHITQRITSELYGPVESFCLQVTQQHHTSCVEMWLLFLYEKKATKVVIDGRFSVQASSILRCATLRELNLRRCKLDSTVGFMGFPSLMSLSLVENEINDSVLQAIVSGSQLLEELQLFGDNDGPIIIDDAPLMKTFNVSVKLLRLGGKFPHVTEVYIDGKLELEGNNKLDHFSKLLPAVENLTLTGLPLTSLAEGVIPTRYTRLKNIMQALRQLDIYDFEMTDLSAAAIIFCMIRNSPFLVELHLMTTRAEVTEEDVNLFEDRNLFFGSQGDVEISRSLVKLEIHYLCGAECDMKLVKSMLSGCPALETVIIANDEEEMVAAEKDADAESQMIGTILGFQKPASAIIKFKLAWMTNQHLFDFHEGLLHWKI